MAPELSDHPTQVGRDRSERRRDSLLASDRMRRPGARPAGDAAAGAIRSGKDAQQLARPRLPLPPVPAAARGAAPESRAASAAGAFATAAPSGSMSPAHPGLDGSAGRGRDAGRPLVDGSSRSAAQSRPTASSGHVPRQTSPDGPESDSYGDWTPAAARFPSRASGVDTEGSLLVRADPLAEAVPQRSAAGRGDRPVDVLDEELPAAGRGRRSTGGRAAMRAERQAADMARRKAEAKLNGGSTSALPVEPEDQARKPRRVLTGLVAMAVVGLGVLGVYTVVAPTPQDASAQRPAVGTPSVAPPTGELPALPSEPVVVEPVVTTPVRVPVTVLNATEVTGLASKISAAVVAGGWESPDVGPYTGGDVPVSTVFFTEGDENQRQAALQLIAQFPQLTGPAPRFFELPADVPATGLVVVAAGDWVP